ncbi:MAG: biotin transporter BioY [Clostridia bacterium]|nr:biotin transporter BioY [Clostridia bacterium]
MKQENKRLKIRNTTIDIAYISVCIALISVCSWISIPSVVPFTLQTFAVFFTLMFLGGKRGTIAILSYLLLGLCGVPIFSNFNGGISAFVNFSSGYLIGFLLMALFFWAFTAIFKGKLWAQIVGLVIGLLICYTFGTIFFILLYTARIESISLISALTICVFPFIPFDLIKLAIGVFLAKLLNKYIPKK